MKQPKIKTDELLRLTCIFAEIDRESYLDAIAHTKDTKEIEETATFLKQLRAYIAADMKQPKIKTDELLRLACLFAETDRESYLDAIAHTKDTKEIEETTAFLKQLRAYRLRRWGETEYEVSLKNTTLVPIQQILSNWEMWAHEENGKFRHFGEKTWVELHGLDLPVVPVTLVESVDGQYYGWLDANRNWPSMVWPSEIQYRMCFPYGPEVEEERGKGRTVRLIVMRGHGFNTNRKTPTEKKK